MKFVIGFLFKTILGFVAINTQNIAGFLVSLALFAWAIADLVALAQMVA